MAPRLLAKSILKPALWLALLPNYTVQAKVTEPVKTNDFAEQVDLNRATVAELMHVPGMTKPWAGRIVRFRPYRTKLDLVQLGVVTPDIYRKIREGVIAHHMAPEAKASGTLTAPDTNQPK